MFAVQRSRGHAITSMVLCGYGVLSDGLIRPENVCWMSSIPFAKLQTGSNAKVKGRYHMWCFEAITPTVLSGTLIVQRVKEPQHIQLTTYKI